MVAKTKMGLGEEVGMERAKKGDFGMAMANLEKVVMIKVVVEGNGIEEKVAMGKSTLRRSKKLPSPPSYYHTR